MAQHSRRLYVCRVMKNEILSKPNGAHPFAPLIDRLKGAGLRPTKQRIALAKLLFQDEDRHVSAEQLHTEAQAIGSRISLATVYNTLNQFTTHGLLRAVVVGPGKSYFDTNVRPHHHFYCEETGLLRDIPAGHIAMPNLPEPPDGSRIKSVEVVIRIAEDKPHRSHSHLTLANPIEALVE